MLGAFTALFASLGAHVPAEDGEALDLSRCHALIVGVLEWQDPAFSPFAKEDRQDALLARTLIERGVPAGQVTLLLDERATREAMEASLERIAEDAGPGSTLLFYYAGHGTRSGETFCFASYDMTRAGNGFEVARIATIVQERFEGERVLLFADCCHSGSLGRVVEALAEHGIEAASVTSVVEENTSTGNWTFTQTLIEALAGDPTHDADGDGAIERGELELAVRDAMAARESQRAASRASDGATELALVAARATPAATRFLALGSDSPPKLRLGAHVRSGESIGRVVGLDEDGGWLIRTYAYATSRDAARPLAELEPLAYDAPPLGTRVGVRLGPDRVAARIVEVDAPFVSVQLEGWPDLPPEWRAVAQLRPVPAEFDATRACMVEWHGEWYPALVLRAEPAGAPTEGSSNTPKEWWIHYVGYGSDWDEKVGPERIRFTAARAGHAETRSE